jgi:dihydroflavonol-4-reductase
MNVLVTGVTGFTGGHLARHLLATGHRVRGLVRERSWQSARPLEAAGVQCRVGDLTSRRSLEGVCDEIDVVYHVAATYREAGQPDAAYRVVNVDGTRHLLEAAAAAGVRRFVHCSTGGVHGHVENPPANEDAPFRPGDIYQETKLAAEELAREFGRSHPIEVTVVRPIGIYGPGDTRFLKMFRGIARGRFPILGSGEVFYHLTYVEDLAEGFRLCGEVPAAAGRTYIVAGPRYTTLNELARLIAGELGVAPPRLRLPVWPFWVAGALCEIVSVPLRVQPPLYRRRVDFYTKSRAFDASRARAELGYVPKVDLAEGIRRTIEWYRVQGML